MGQEIQQLRKSIFDELTKIVDPEIGVSIMELELIDKVDIEDGKVKIETEKDIREFYKQIGFIEGVQITHTSKFWPAIEKQKLLRKVIESYNSPTSFYSLPQFDLSKVMI